MKTLILASAAAVVALAIPFVSTAQQAPDGAALFESRCKFCHESGPGPAKDVIGKLAPTKIVEVLTSGAMAGMAAGMSDADKQAIAAYLTKASAPAAASATPEAPAGP